MTAIFLEACQFVGRYPRRENETCFDYGEDDEPTSVTEPTTDGVVVLTLSLRGFFVTLAPRIRRGTYALEHLCVTAINVPALLVVARSDTFHLTLELDLVLDEDLTAQVSHTLTKLRQVQMLRIASSRLSDEGLKRLSGTNVAIHALNLNYSTSFTALGAQCIGQITSLRRLEIQNCLGVVNDASLQSLSQLCSLTCLKLSTCSIGDAGLEHLKSTKSLQDLDLAGCTFVTDAGLAHIGCISSLLSLRLTYLSINTGVKFLGDLPFLQNLALDESTAIRDDALAALAEPVKFQSLTHLNLSSCKRYSLTIAGWTQLSRVKTLQSLTIVSTGINSAGLTQLSNLPSLRDLDARYNAVTIGECFEALQCGPMRDSLESLNISSYFVLGLKTRMSTCVPEELVAFLLSFKSLRHVTIEGSSTAELLDAQCRETLRAALPNLVVEGSM